jgi:hypothetical protein
MIPTISHSDISEVSSGSKSSLEYEPSVKSTSVGAGKRAGVNDMMDEEAHTPPPCKSHGLECC